MLDTTAPAQLLTTASSKHVQTYALDCIVVHCIPDNSPATRFKPARIMHALELCEHMLKKVSMSQRCEMKSSFCFHMTCQSASQSLSVTSCPLLSAH